MTMLMMIMLHLSELRKVVLGVSLVLAMRD